MVFQLVMWDFVSVSNIWQGIYRVNSVSVAWTVICMTKARPMEMSICHGYGILCQEPYKERLVSILWDIPCDIYKW